MVVGCIVDFFLKIWDTTDDLYHHIIRRYRSQSIRDNSKKEKKNHSEFWTFIMNHHQDMPNYHV